MHKIYSLLRRHCVLAVILQVITGLLSLYFLFSTMIATSWFAWNQATNVFYIVSLLFLLGLTLAVLTTVIYALKKREKPKGKELVCLLLFFLLSALLGYIHSAYFSPSGRSAYRVTVADKGSDPYYYLVIQTDAGDSETLYCAYPEYLLMEKGETYHSLSYCSYSLFGRSFSILNYAFPSPDVPGTSGDTIPGT